MDVSRMRERQVDALRAELATLRAQLDEARAALWEIAKEHDADTMWVIARTALAKLEEQ